MKKILLIDNDKFYSDLYQRAFKVHSPQVEFYASIDISTDLLPEIKKIKPDVIVVSLDMQVDPGMEIMKTIRQTEEIKNTTIAVFVNTLANDYSREALKDLDVAILGDKIDLIPSHVVVEKILALK